MSVSTEWAPAGYDELDEVDQQKVDDLIARVLAEPDEAVRKAILDEALASARRSAA